MDGTPANASEQIWWGTVALLLVLLAITFAVSVMDKRLIDGVGVWAKPMKFQLSLALHFATLALVLRQLSGEWRASTVVLVIALASVAATAFEIFYIMAQAARQERSHFNLTTPVYAAMYVLMAIGAVVITAAAGALGVVAALDKAAHLADSTRQAIALGLVGGTVLTLIVAFNMGGRLTHHVGVEAAGAAVMPFTGWSLTVGDLRVPHFFATHMMQAVPLAGLAAAGLASVTTATVLVWLVAFAWAALTLLTFQQALAGEPLVAWMTCL